MDEENKIDIVKYLERFYVSFMKYKKIWMIIVFVFVVVSFGKTFLSYSNSYSSKAIFIPSVSGKVVYEAKDEQNDFLSVFNSLIQGNDMKKMIEENLDVIDYSITTYRLPETNLIELKVTSKDSQVSYDVIQYIMNNYSRITEKVMKEVKMMVLDTPQLAKNPDEKAGYIKNGLKGLTNGIIVCMGLTVFMALFHKHILNGDDVKDILHVECVAKICEVPTQKKSKILLTNPRIQTSFRQSFHDLRMKLEQNSKKNNAQVYMFTSSLPNEGKSTISLNSAIALAMRSHSVVLVDLDLRNPSIFRLLEGKKLSYSVSDYLFGRCSNIKHALHPIMDNLDVMCSSDSSEYATELLSLPSFEKMIQTLKKEYEYVLLDVPPLYMMEDACMIAKYCDSACIVVRQDYADANDILDSLEELNNHIPSIMGVILNRVKPSIFNQDENGYGYGSKYGYGYVYGKEKN